MVEIHTLTLYESRSRIEQTTAIAEGRYRSAMAAA
jgi:hypothetical protein